MHVLALSDIRRRVADRLAVLYNIFAAFDIPSGIFMPIL
jgi:hypothetical protein